MNMDKYTQKSQEAILDAQRLAQELNHQAIEPAHLLLALLRQEDGVVPALVTKVAGSPAALRDEMPAGAGEAPQGLRRRRRRWACHARQPTCWRPPSATPRACRMNTSPPSISCSADRQHRKASGWPVRPDQGRHPEGAGQRARLAARHLPEPGRHLPGAGEIRARPDRPGPPGQARPGHRPGRGNPPRGADPFAAHQEQPGADRRAGRGQDGHRRRAGAAHRQRRCARRAEEQAPGAARYGRAGGRRQVPRRVRGAPESRAEGDHRRGRARSSCSWTRCTRWSARARPKAPWTPATCSSRCWRAASCT